MRIMAETNGPRELNLQMHRAPESVWDRRGWDGTREEIAMTRLLLGIGGAALAVQGIRLRHLDRPGARRSRRNLSPGGR